MGLYLELSRPRRARQQVSLAQGEPSSTHLLLCRCPGTSAKGCGYISCSRADCPGADPNLADHITPPPPGELQSHVDWGKWGQEGRAERRWGTGGGLRQSLKSCPLSFKLLWHYSVLEHPVVSAASGPLHMYPSPTQECSFLSL